MKNPLLFKKIHIIGIAGAGLNGTANIFLEQGKEVTGSERLHNTATDYLRSRGVVITTDEDLSAIEGADLVLRSLAVKEPHPIIDYAKQHNIPVITREAIWKEWSKEREIIAVSGSHGKTTTTAMLIHIFKTTKQPCGFLLGVHGDGSSSWGAGPFIIEADEYQRSFLSLVPRLAIVTNVDRDHVDAYKTDREYEGAFREFAEITLRNRGVIVACLDDKGAERTLAGLPFISYSIDNLSAEWTARNISTTERGLKYDLLHKGTKLADIMLPILGQHNVLNSLAAIAAAAQYKIHPEKAAKALATFPSLYRRMQYKGETIDGITVFDDYAHAPAEVAATLRALKARYPSNRLVAYFQPHTFSRLQAFFHDFVKVLPIADIALIDEIYAARETGGNVSSADLVDKISMEQKYATHGPEDAVKQLMKILQPNDVLVTLTAGSGTMIGGKILELKGVKPAL